MSNRTFRAAVGAFIFNQDCELLIVLKHGYVNKWDIVKGGLEFNGEDEISGLRREIEEELGVKEINVLKRSMTPKVFLKPKFDWISSNTNEHLGQAQVNYWVYLDKNIELKVPNDELESYKWIKIERDSIKEHFNVHDAEGTYQNFLPIEWELIKDELLKEIA